MSKYVFIRTRNDYNTRDKVVSLECAGAWNIFSVGNVSWNLITSWQDTEESKS